jgi:hypothetical protein
MSAPVAHSRRKSQSLVAWRRLFDQKVNPSLQMHIFVGIRSIALYRVRLNSPWHTRPSDQSQIYCDLISMRLFSASSIHKSRLHDMSGDLISVSRLLRNGPRALITTIGRVIFNVRPELPWISYDAQAEIARRLGPNKRALEFGSGMSTAWFAARVSEIVSIEDHKGWFETVQGKFRLRGIANAHFRLAPTKSEYLTLTEREKQGGFDFVLIDGRFRDDCVDTAISHLNPGGCIYLDNSDQTYQDEANGSCSGARNKLHTWANENQGSVMTFTDFAPTLAFVTRGELFTRPL